VGEKTVGRLKSMAIFFIEKLGGFWVGQIMTLVRRMIASMETVEYLEMEINK
jgi:hypothetical protein